MYDYKSEIVGHTFLDRRAKSALVPLPNICQHILIYLKLYNIICENALYHIRFVFFILCGRLHIKLNNRK